MQTVAEAMLKKESEGRNKLERLYMDNAIVRRALDAHKYHGLSYEEALEVAVIALAEANESLTSSLKAAHFNSPISITVPAGHAISR